MFAKLKTVLSAIGDFDLPPLLMFWWILFGGIALCALAGFLCQLLAPARHTELLAYFFLLAFLFCINAIRLLSQKWLVSLARQEDESYINHLLATARAVQPTVGTKDSPERPKNYKQKRSEIQSEIARIKALPVSQRVEWELLPLQNLLLDFMNVHVLISQARLKLDDLEEYAADTAYSIDREKFENLRHSVLNAIERALNAITKSKNLQFDSEQQRESFVDDGSAELRASTQAIQEYLIDYRWNWSNGNVTLAGLKLSCVFSIPGLILVGLLPVGLLETQPVMAWFKLGVYRRSRGNNVRAIGVFDILMKQKSVTQPAVARFRER